MGRSNKENYETGNQKDHQTLARESRGMKWK